VTHSVLVGALCLPPAHAFVNEVGLPGPATVTLPVEVRLRP
jgi:hypothetical protein